MSISNRRTCTTPYFPQKSGPNSGAAVKIMVLYRKYDGNKLKPKNFSWTIYSSIKEHVIITFDDNMLLKIRIFFRNVLKLLTHKKILWGKVRVQNRLQLVQTMHIWVVSSHDVHNNSISTKTLVRVKWHINVMLNQVFEHIGLEHNNIQTVYIHISNQNQASDKFHSIAVVLQVNFLKPQDQKTIIWLFYVVLLIEIYGRACWLLYIFHIRGST